MTEHNATQGRAEALREQREFGLHLKADCIAKGIRLSDVGAELDLDATGFSAVINGRRVWQPGIEDLKTKVSQAVEHLGVAEAAR